MPNRTLFRDRLARAIGRARRDDRLVGLVFLDLDQFKKINDSMGHYIGDQLLLDISKPLSVEDFEDYMLQKKKRIVNE